MYYTVDDMLLWDKENKKKIFFKGRCYSFSLSINMLKHFSEVKKKTFIRK